MSGRAAAALAAFGPMSAEDARVFLVRLFFGEYPNTDAATAAAALYGALSLAILGLTLKNRRAGRARPRVQTYVDMPVHLCSRGTRQACARAALPSGPQPRASCTS